MSKQTGLTEQRAPCSAVERRQPAAAAAAAQIRVTELDRPSEA